jgi:predicted site-specific integrase-resolvase
MDEEKHLMVRQKTITDKYQISGKLLNEWCMRGLVNFIRLPGDKGSGHRRYNLADVERIFQKKAEKVED